MSQENLAAELEAQNVEVKTSRARRVFSTEDVKQIVAGIDLLESLGADEKLVRMLRTLAPVWHSEDKDALALAKKQNIEEFGGIEEFKNWVESTLRDALAPYAGIVKLIPICNNIGSFYARRATTKTAKYKNVAIDGVNYQVNAQYLVSITTPERTRDEIRELVLSHADTKKLETATIEL